MRGLNVSGIQRLRLKLQDVSQPLECHEVNQEAQTPQNALNLTARELVTK
jgi:hypothetical protein